MNSLQISHKCNSLHVHWKKMWHQKIFQILMAKFNVRERKGGRPKTNSKSHQSLDYSNSKHNTKIIIFPFQVQWIKFQLNCALPSIWLSMRLSFEDYHFFFQIRPFKTTINLPSLILTTTILHNPINQPSKHLPLNLTVSMNGKECQISMYCNPIILICKNACLVYTVCLPDSIPLPSKILG